MHDLIRLFASELGHVQADDDRRTEATERLYQYYLDTTAAAARWLHRLPGAAPRGQQEPFESYEQAVTWLDLEGPALVAAISAAHSAAAWEHSHRIAVTLGGYFEFRHHVDDWLTTGTLAVEAGRKLGAQAELEAALTLGNAYRLAHRYEESVACEQRALALAEDDRNRSAALHNLGLAYFCQGRYMKAEFAHQRDRRLCTLRGDLRGAAQAGVALGDALRARRRFPEAAKALERAIAQFEALKKHGLSDPRGLMNARMNLALTYLDGRPLLTASYIIWQLCSALAIARIPREMG